MSLVAVMLLSFGYTLVFGRQVIHVLALVKVSQEVEVLQKLTRFIFLACSQNVCVAAVLVANNFYSCENIIVPFPQCFVAWYGAYRVLEVAGCVLVILAVRRAYSEEESIFISDEWTEQFSSQGIVNSSVKPSSFPPLPALVSGPSTSVIVSPLITSFVSTSFFSLDELLLRAGEDMSENDFLEGGQSIAERLLSPVNDGF